MSVLNGFLVFEFSYKLFIFIGFVEAITWNLPQLFPTTLQRTENECLFNPDELVTFGQLRTF